MDVTHDSFVDIVHAFEQVQVSQTGNVAIRNRDAHVVSFLPVEPFGRLDDLAVPIDAEAMSLDLVSVVRTVAVDQIAYIQMQIILRCVGHCILMYSDFRERPYSETLFDFR